MKIAAIDVFRVDMPMKGFFRNARHNHNVQPVIVVRARADDGFEGMGDVEPMPGYTLASRDDIADAVERRLVPALLGADPRRARDAARRMNEAAAGCFEGKAALAMALADLHAKALGVPLHELLGGAVRDEVFFNAWIGVQPPEEAAAEIRRFRDRGWRACKVKVCGEVEGDAARVLAVREAAGGDFEIRVDANESYARVEDAVAFAREVAGAGVRLFEQPVPRDDIEGLARVRRTIDIPVMADECVFGHESLLRIIRAEAADIVKVKVMKQGGPLVTREMASTAEAAGLGLVIGHGFGLSAHTLAEVHVAATSAAFLPALEAVGPEKMTGDVVDRPVDIGAGRMAVPQGPGLGVSLDEDRLERYLAKGAARA